MCKNQVFSEEKSITSFDDVATIIEIAGAQKLQEIISRCTRENFGRTVEELIASGFFDFEIKPFAINTDFGELFGVILSSMVVFGPDMINELPISGCFKVAVTISHGGAIIPYPTRVAKGIISFGNNANNSYDASELQAFYKEHPEKFDVSTFFDPDTPKGARECTMFRDAEDTQHTNQI